MRWSARGARPRDSRILRQTLAGAVLCLAITVAMIYWWRVSLPLLGLYVLTEWWHSRTDGTGEA